MTVTHIPTSCDQIDNLLGGGFEIGKVSEICGESAIGKTQLCLQTLVAALLPVHLGGLGGCAMYFSFMLPFPLKRFKSLWSVREPNCCSLVSERLHFVSGSTPRELLDMINGLEHQLKGGRNRTQLQARCP